jgi:polyisoprenoid-binding protein YceI
MKLGLIYILFLVAFQASGGDLVLDAEQSWLKATAHATGHNFTVVPEDFACHLELDGAQRLTAATFSCSLDHLKSGKAKRDKEMWHWLQVEQWPELTFEMTALKNDENGMVMVGNLALHNHTQPVEIPITVSSEGDQVTVNGATTIDTTQFGLKVIRKFGILTVDRDVRIEFAMTGTHPAMGSGQP